MQSKVLAAAIFLCMLLTACGVKVVTGENTTVPTTTPISTKGSNADPAVPETGEIIQTTPSADQTTAPPVVSTTPTSNTTPLPETNPALVTTPAPVTTSSPVTTPSVTTTQKPTTTTTAPVTTAEPVLEAVPKASDVVGRIPASPAVDPSWFDDACFIGDSVTEGLKTYCLSGRLGGAKFFAVRSYSTVNALRALSSGGPHPSYQGVKMLSEDCVQKSGSKKVFIMLGVNDMYYGVDSTVNRYQQLIGRILVKSPDAKIFVQSVTPMTSTSSYAGDMLNNTNIRRFNEKMEKACEENGWYFVNVASVMFDSSGTYLRQDYCSDKNSMGIHFNTKGYQQWVNYLLTHTVDFTDSEIPEEPITEPAVTTTAPAATEPKDPMTEPTDESSVTTTGSLETPASLSPSESAEDKENEI